MGIVARLATVQAKVQGLAQESATVQMKAGGSYTYKYTSEESMYDFLRPLLAEEQIATSAVRADLIGTDGNMVRVKVEVDFSCEDEKEVSTVTWSMIAQATDMGDKAMAKAITSATRYLYWKGFRFPGRDPFADEAASSEAHVTQATVDREATEARVRAKTKALWDLCAEKHLPTAGLSAQIKQHLSETGLVVPDEAFIDALMKGATAEPARPAAASASEGSGVPPEGDALTPAAKPAGAVSDPFSGQPAAGPGIADAQKQRLMQLVDELEAINSVGRDVRVAAMDARASDWYHVAGVTDLSAQDAADMIEKVEQTVLQMKEAG